MPDRPPPPPQGSHDLRNAPAGRTLHLYCDESCTDKGHNRVVFGGVMIDVQEAAKYKAELLEWREERRMKSELKWTRISNNKSVEYTDYLTMAVDRIKRGKMSFHAMVMEKREIDYRTHHDGDEELGFYRFLFQLLFHRFCKTLSVRDTLTIFPDYRHTPYDFNNMRDSLNSKLRSYCQNVSSPVKKVIPINSKSSELMQVNDLLMGAVGFHCNLRHLKTGTNQAKIQFAERLSELLNLSGLNCDASRCMGQFGIWKFKFNEKSAPNS